MIRVLVDVPGRLFWLPETQLYIHGGVAKPGCPNRSILCKRALLGLCLHWRFCWRCEATAVSSQQAKSSSQSAYSNWAKL